MSDFIKTVAALAVVTMIVVAVVATRTTAAQGHQQASNPADTGGEWSPSGKDTHPIAYRGCLHNKTYSSVTLTIARPRGATSYTLSPGSHYRLWLYHGDAIFVAGNPASNKINAFEKYSVSGETTVSIFPTKLEFIRGVEECEKHPDEAQSR